MKTKTIMILIILIIFSVIFSIANIGNEKIIGKNYIGSKNIQGKSKIEAIKYLKEEYNKKIKTNIKLVCGNYEEEILLEDFDIKIKTEEAINMAYLRGRSKNIVLNNYKILFATIIPKKYKINIEYDENKIDKCINEIENILPDKYEDISYYIENNKLKILSGKKGKIIDKNQLKNKIIENIKQIDTIDRIEIVLKEKEKEKIDIEKILKEVEREPVDAKKEGEKIEIEKDGIKADLSKSEIFKILEQGKNEYEIPLKIEKPKIKITDLNQNIFVDKLATYTTNYDASNLNKDNNLQLSSQKLNGTIINPNEIFSFNKTIGQRTINSGYKEGKTYVGNKVVLNIGGGICQLSSTLYNSCLLANFEIVERHNHTFLPTYVPVGRDATVSWGTVDLKFKNNRKYPVKILSNSEYGVVTITIMGIKEKEDGIVILNSKTKEVLPQDIVYIQDKRLQKGEEIVEQEGYDGALTETYKKVLKNGFVVSEEVITRDKYIPLNKKVRRNN